MGLSLIAFALVAAGVVAQAQQPAKIPTIGYLVATPSFVASAWMEGFRQGLAELNYIEGKNISIESRFAAGRLERFPALAAELLDLKVDVILSGGPSATRVVKELTQTVPIVMAQDNDPVGSGFVASLARPGGNITGLSTLAPEISGKHLELLKETVPKLSRVAVLGTSTNPGIRQSVKEIELAAVTFGLKIHYIDLLTEKDFEIAFRTATKGGAGAIVVLGSPLINSHPGQIVELANKTRLPTIYNTQSYVNAGGLMTYGANFRDLYRRAATYVDKLLRGAKPADLPVEQPKKFDFIVNLKAAKQIGLTIPPNVLVRADRVIR